MEEDLRKPYRNMTLACLVSQFYIELGPAQPQLLFIILPLPPLPLEIFRIVIKDNDKLGLSWAKLIAKLANKTS